MLVSTSSFDHVFHIACALPDGDDALFSLVALIALSDSDVFISSFALVSSVLRTLRSKRTRSRSEI